MTLTRWQLALRAAQEPVTKALKPLGFRRIGNYYNRSAEDGLVQVVGFQSGQAVSILHGNFTVNLGVYIPSIASLEGNSASGRAVTDAHCEIRSRLSAVSGSGSDQWWKLDDSSSRSGSIVADALIEHGVPFLDRYRSALAIISRFGADGSLPSHNPARSTLAVAVLHWSRGDREDAQKLFERARTTPSHNVHFSDYVSKIQSRCGA
jgi:hypothetical protein